MPRVTHYESTNHVVIQYPIHEAEQIITRAEADLISTRTVSAVVAIKFIKDQYNLGLYEAKQLVDTIRAANEKPEY